MVYLDTSAAVPLFVAEPSSDLIDRWFGACDVPVVSPDRIMNEFASALSIKERSGTLNAKDAKAAWRSFETFCRSGLRAWPP
jgi:predicted nucleic acid-binding protein